MKNLTIIYAIALLAAILVVSCSHSVKALNDAYKRGLNLEDPNLDNNGPVEGTDPEIESVIVYSQEAVRQPSGIITVVRLCRNASGRLAFPSTGICLRGRTLYAEIGNTEGRYTLLKPGRYSANAVGSPCSFTVGENCEVAP